MRKLAQASILVTGMLLAGLCMAWPKGFERYTTQYGKWRDFNVISNVMYAANEHYWAYPEDSQWRAPCGGASNCIHPLLAETAICWVEETDCWRIEGHDTPEYVPPIILRTFVLECVGTIDCEKEHLPSEFCCELIDVVEEQVRRLD